MWMRKSREILSRRLASFIISTILVLSSFVCNHNQTIDLIALWFDNRICAAGKHTRHNRNEIGNTNEYIVCACADTITCPQFSEKIIDSTRLELSDATPVPFHVPNEYIPFYANEEPNMCSRCALCIHITHIRIRTRRCSAIHHTKRFGWTIVEILSVKSFNRYHQHRNNAINECTSESPYFNWFALFIQNRVTTVRSNLPVTGYVFCGYFVFVAD